ncbi:MAG: M23 family metallopeptidase [Anaerolineaceae bacterium]|nr:M23 family metallopeptidase [Anaerolineaceae bacterium]
MGYWIRRLLILGVVLVLVVGGGYAGFRLYSASQSNSIAPIQQWFSDVASRRALITMRNQVACPGAPFILPSDGFIGLLWNDPAGPYTLLNTHTGVDIFGDGEPGEVPVYAAYDGYLTRLDSWFSTVIIRHDDPLQPGRIIWTYYTHMAARDGEESFIAPEFPPGTHGVWVTQGTLLGYQGEYAGEGARPIGLHLHFSIVQSEPDGAFKNESRVANTLDPSPYLGMPVAITGFPERPINCES